MFLKSDACDFVTKFRGNKKIMDKNNEKIIYQSNLL